MDDTHKADIRTEVTNILKQAKPPKDNMSKKERINEFEEGVVA